MMDDDMDATLAADERLRRLLDAVITDHQPLAVFLFGSRAEGRDEPDSDYDLLVVLPDDTSDDALDVGRAQATGARVHVPADIIPTTRSLFLECEGSLCTVEGLVHLRGKLLFGAV